jgi:hypothetical protein
VAVRLGLSEPLLKDGGSDGANRTVQTDGNPRQRMMALAAEIAAGLDWPSKIGRARLANQGPDGVFSERVLSARFSRSYKKSWQPAMVRLAMDQLAMDQQVMDPLAGDRRRPCTARDKPTADA